MDLSKLAEEIKDLDYFVMRNFESLPVLHDGNDLDLFVSNKHYEALKEACARYLPDHLFDIRTYGDDYYSKNIEDGLLPWKPKYHGGFKIPEEEVEMVLLMYHGWVHKGDDRYLPRIKKLFYELAQPVPPKDPGVGFHGVDTN